MSRLIDADALCELANNTKDKTIDANDIMRFPTVDAVEVVRCVDCVYHGKCMLQHFVESNAVDGAKIDWSEWYCADGERQD